MADITNLSKIALGALKVSKPSAEFSKQDYRKAFDGEFARLLQPKSKADYLRVKPDLFELLQTVGDEYIPARIRDTFGVFADVVNIPQGSRMEFPVKRGKLRGRGMVTQVAPGGQYEAFRLDTHVITPPVISFGGAGIVDWERVLNGQESLIELIETVGDGITDRIYGSIQGLMRSAQATSSNPNYYSGAAFTPAEMDKLISVVRAYGAPVIYASPEFAATITNMMGVPASNPNLPEADLNDIREFGYVGRYKGCPVIVLPQTFADVDNKVKLADPKVAYVIPQGDEKLVKILLEGGIQIKDDEKQDWSVEFQAYQKVGMGLVSLPNYWAMYNNTSLN